MAPPAFFVIMGPEKLHPFCTPFLENALFLRIWDRIYWKINSIKPYIIENNITHRR